MPNDPRLQAGLLLDDCTRLLQLARLVARQPPADAEELEELERATLAVVEALDALRMLTAELDPGEAAISEGSVGGIVQRILRRPRGQRRAAGDTTAALRRRARRREEELFHGHSKTVPIPDLLSFLQMQSKTGVLRVVLPSEVISIHFEGGDLTGAVSSNSPPGCLLGEILVEQGTLHRLQLEAFLVHYSSSQGLLGTALEVHDLVSETELCTALTCQIQRLFHRLLAAEDAIFEFRNGEPEELYPETRLNVTQLLLESARYVDEGSAAAPPKRTVQALPPPPPEPQPEPQPEDGLADIEDIRAAIRDRLARDWARDA